MQILFVEAGVSYRSSIISKTGVHLGLLSLASYLRDKGCDAQLSFCSMQLQHALSTTFSVEDEIRRTNPDVVCISALTSSFPRVLEIARAAKRHGSCVIIGGIFASLNSTAIIEHYPEIDIVVRGDGEATLLETLGELERQESLEHVQGLTFRQDGVAEYTPSREPLDLSTLPSPAYDLLPIDSYLKLGVPATIETARGCTFDCEFCSMVDEEMGGRRYRTKSIPRIIEEIRQVRQYGFKSSWVCDDTFTLQRARTEAICAALERDGQPLHLIVLTRLDLLDTNLLRLMHQAGIREIVLGVESVSQRSLQTMRKTTSDSNWKQRARRVIVAAGKLGFVVHPIFMLGWPGETKETLKQTVDFAVELGRHTQVEPFVSFPTPHPGSRFWRNAASLGLQLVTTDLSKYIHLYPVAVPVSLGGLDALPLLVRAHNTIRSESGTTQRNPRIDLEFVLSYVDTDDQAKRSVWYNLP